jgi:hypothetical protein
MLVARTSATLVVRGGATAVGVTFATSVGSRLVAEHSRFHNNMEHFFTTFVRTKTLFKQRLKDCKDYDTVKLYVYELDKLGVNNGPLLYALRERGEIWYDDKGNFKALKEGPIDPSLLDRAKKRQRVKVDLTPLHLYMRNQLRFVSLVDTDEEDIPVYFNTFLQQREGMLDAFFTVDDFSGRVHTPVVNLKGELRKRITLCGEPVASLDVKQMQPTILAKVLIDSVGENPFSTEIFNGVDVYEMLQKSGGLASRAEAKVFLFKLIFGKPMNDVGKLFKGNTEWVEWINSYKSKTEERNPHKQDMHTNLAWLLQYSEVQVMTGIWEVLKRRGIPFLTIHDDVLCRRRDKDEVHRVMDNELKKHFKFFTVVIDH